MKKISFSIFIFILIFSYSTSTKFQEKTKEKHKLNHAKAAAIKSMPDAFTYLTQYGYDSCKAQPESNRNNESMIPCQSSFELMLKQFQSRYRLPVTGKLDHETLKLMNTPRCGMVDNPYGSLPFNRDRAW
jgi:hypothetical protein